MAPLAHPELHADDVRTAEAESKSFVSALLGLVPDSARWLNPREATFKAENKLLQLVAAQRCGLRVPRTVATNDLRELLAFAQRQRGNSLLYKGFRVHEWREGSARRVSYANTVDERDLTSHELIAACPGIYQSYLRKSFEVRCAVWGDDCYAIKLHSDGRVDWREGVIGELRPQPFELPSDVKANCRRLLKELGIAMGAFDFVIDECGQFVFLEVNEQGQFLFMEEVCPELPVLDGFCRFLARLGDEDAPRVRLDRVAA